LPKLSKKAIFYGPPCSLTSVTNHGTVEKVDAESCSNDKQTKHSGTCYQPITSDADEYSSVHQLASYSRQCMTIG